MAAVECECKRCLNDSEDQLTWDDLLEKLNLCQKSHLSILQNRLVSNKLQTVLEMGEVPLETMIKLEPLLACLGKEGCGKLEPPQLTNEEIRVLKTIVEQRLVERTGRILKIDATPTGNLIKSSKTVPGDTLLEMKKRCDEANNGCYSVKELSEQLSELVTTRQSKFIHAAIHKLANKINLIDSGIREQREDISSEENSQKCAKAMSILATMLKCQKEEVEQERERISSQLEEYHNSWPDRSLAKEYTNLKTKIQRTKWAIEELQ